MNKKYIWAVSFVAVAFVSIFVTTTLKAQTNRTFSQANASTITAVDVNARTITVSYMQLGAPCSPTYCPSGRLPDVLREGEVMAINTLDQVENDFTKMKVGDSVTVYFRQDGAASTPYAIKDFTLVPPGCDPVTKICSGSGSGGSGTGTITPIKPSLTSIPTITQDLSVGASGEQVSALQLKLQNLGHFPGSLQPTGYFGPITKKAVQRFQAKYGIPQTGYVGPLTRAKLNELYTSNDQLTCILVNGTVGNILINSTATFSASGGNGVYSWSFPGGKPSFGTGNQFSTVSPTTGIFTVTVTSGIATATCDVSIVAP